MHKEDDGEIIDSIEGDSQCPTCGSNVMASDIKETNSLESYAIGFACGVIGAASCVTVLAFAGAVNFAFFG